MRDRVRSPSPSFFLLVCRLRNSPKGSVILCDRGTLDGKIFLEDGEFDKVMAMENITERALLERYDCVVHMVSAAIDAEEHYEHGPGSNNPDRYHDLEGAKAADYKGRDIYQAHPHFLVIDNSSGFDRKVDRAHEQICQRLGLDNSMAGEPQGSPRAGKEANGEPASPDSVMDLFGVGPASETSCRREANPPAEVAALC